MSPGLGVAVRIGDALKDMLFRGENTYPQASVGGIGDWSTFEAIRDFLYKFQSYDMLAREKLEEAVRSEDYEKLESEGKLRGKSWSLEHVDTVEKCQSEQYTRSTRGVGEYTKTRKTKDWLRSYCVVGHWTHTSSTSTQPEDAQTYRFDTEY